MPTRERNSTVSTIVDSVYAPIPGHPDIVVVITGDGVEEPRPITPVELDSLRRIREASDEAEACVGTPAFWTMSSRWEALAVQHMEIFGVCPDTSVRLICGHPLTAMLDVPQCSPECWD